MDLYSGLHKSLGRPTRQSRPDASFFREPVAKADEELADLWREDGWSAYADGAFWTVDPRSYADIRETWPILPEGALVFSRNAFGDLYFMSSGNVWRLDIQNGRTLDLGPSAYIFLNSTLKEKSLKDSLLRVDLFKKVSKRVGGLQSGECYGLFPALPLGGDEDDPDSYRKAGLREYLNIVAQLHG